MASYDDSIRFPQIMEIANNSDMWTIYPYLSYIFAKAAKSIVPYI